MKVQTPWWQHVDNWRVSGLTQAEYCRQHGLHNKTFSTWTRRRRPADCNIPLDIIPVHVCPAEAVSEANTVITLRLQAAVLELSTAVSPRWLAELLQCLA